MPTPPPNFTAVLLGLSGCLVDFGARSKVTQHAPHSTAYRAFDNGSTATQIQPDWIDPVTINSADYAQPTPGALELLHALQRKNISCMWLDDLPVETAARLAEQLPNGLRGCLAQRPWPAPDACWQALIELNAKQHAGCVLISSDPRMLKAGLNAGFWTIGLATCGAPCGQSLQEWDQLSQKDRDKLRADVTLQLYHLGAHSVIDDLRDSQSCLAELHKRHCKGERP